MCNCLSAEHMRLDSRGMFVLTPVAARKLNFALSSAACEEACANGRKAQKTLRNLYNIYEGEAAKAMPHRFHIFTIQKHDEIVADAQLTLRVLEKMALCGAAAKLREKLREEFVELERIRRRYNRLVHPLVASASAADPPPQRPKRCRKE